MREIEARNLPVGARIRYTGHGMNETGTVNEKFASSMRIEWDDGTYGRMDYLQSEHLERA